MNVQRSFFEINFILFLLLSNTALFGMRYNHKDNLIVQRKEELTVAVPLLLKNEPENRLLFNCDNNQGINRRLVKAIYFGSDKDIKKELKRNTYDNFFDNSFLGDAIKDLGSYSNEKNNALKLLLLRLKKINKQKDHGDIWRGTRYFQLLSVASNNKKTFDLVSSIDPYCANSLIWKNPRTGNELTTLEHMADDARFDQKHIRILINNYGMTTGEVLQMYFVDAILSNLPRRDSVLMSYEQYHEIADMILHQQELPEEPVWYEVD